MVIKQFYEAPDAELLIVHFEEGFLNGPSTGTSNVEIPDEEDDDL